MKSAIPCYYHLDVEVSPERIDQVRRILTAHLRHWGLEVLVESVCHCTGVLLREIDEYGADKRTVVEMWWSGQHLITAVSDNNRDLPERHYGPQGCLTQIAAMSDGWGSFPATNGKIIWFSRRARAPERAPLAPAAPAPSLREALELPREVRHAVLANPDEAEAPVPAAVATPAAASAHGPGHGPRHEPRHGLRPDAFRTRMAEKEPAV
ncbi:pep a2 [Streptomyces sp. NPDC018029]|uniref:pep a2 n=1 Tax=Streptomyces sp. NPDC018029 TaxID=3365032 RepID=UPI0037A74505